jgi:hypothetical protein
MLKYRVVSYLRKKQVADAFYRKNQKRSKKLKKIIYVFGIFFIAIVLILNLIFTANLDASEHITINYNSIIYILGLIIFGLGLFFGSKILDEKLKLLDDKKKKKLEIIVIVIYALFNCIWCIVVRPAVVGDQIHAYNLAQTFYSGDDEKFLSNLTYAGIPLIEYMQAYHQQISLAFVFSIVFRIIHFDELGVLRALNIIGNVAIVIALIFINKQISKSYETNKVRLLLFIVTFMSLSMLSTFIYGDIPSIALCLFSVYFVMKYRETGKNKYVLFASIFTMIAFMMRMNSLIFIIATCIYLILN